MKQSPLSFSYRNNELAAGSFASRKLSTPRSGPWMRCFSAEKKITGLETHYGRLDDMTSGLQPSELIIIAGRPSMGKTAFAMNVAENASIDDRKTVAVFSLEMAKEALLERMLCSRARVNSHRMRTGTLWREDMPKILAAMEELVKAPLYIDDTGVISLSELRAKSRRLQQTTGRLDLVIVDYLQLMSPGARRYENRTQEVSAVSRGLKSLAKELQVPVIALSQLSRATEGAAEIIAPSYPTYGNRGPSSKTQMW